MEKKKGQTEWWLDGYRPSETALMLATGAAVSSVETLVCALRCVCLPNRANSVYWQTAVTSAQPGSFTSVVRHKHTHRNSVSVCPSFVSLGPLFCLNFLLRVIDTQRCAPLHYVTKLTQQCSRKAFKICTYQGVFFFHLKKRSHKLELPLRNAWSGTTSLSGSGWRHNTTPQNTTVLNRTVVCVWWASVWSAGR